MSEQQGDAPLQYSPDGRWWWDGHEWVPVQGAGTPGAVPSNLPEASSKRVVAALVRAIPWVATAAFLLACLTPALEFSSRVMPGYELLLTGWLGILALQFAWFANPLLLTAIVCTALRAWRWSLTLGALALAFSADTLLLFVWPVPDPPASDMLLDRVLFGGWTWWGSILVVVVGSAIGLALGRSGRQAALTPGPAP